MRGEESRTSYLSALVQDSLVENQKTTYLSIKELLNTRQSLLPVYTESCLNTVYWVFCNGKDDRGYIVVVVERVYDGHLLCR